MRTESKRAPRTICYCNLVAVSMLGAGNVTLAQENGDGAVDEIVVTSTKRGDKVLQDTAASIGVLTSDTLVRMGAQGFEDISRTIVGLDIVNRGVGDNTIMIRGVNAEGESAAAIVWDNMATSGAGEDSSDLGRRQIDLDVYDIEQVEVLRGPQGTLYGSSSLSGVVRFVTKKPDLEDTGAEFVVSGSNVAHGGTSWSQRGFINLPIVPGQVAGRLVGYHRDDAGFIDAVPFANPFEDPANPDDDIIGMSEEDVNGWTRSGLRASIAAVFDDNTDVLLQYFFQNTNSGSKAEDRPFDTSFGPPFARVVAPADGDYRRRQTGTSDTQEDVSLMGVTLNHEFAGGTQMTFSSSYQTKDTTLQSDLTGLTHFMRGLGRPRAVGNQPGCLDPNDPAATGQSFPVVCLPGAGDGALGGAFRSLTEMDLWTSELRFATNRDSAINFVGGIQGQRRLIDVHNVMLETDPTTGQVLPLTADNTAMFERTGTFEFNEVAAFGQVIWDINDAWSANIGARFFDNEKADGGVFLIPFFAGLSDPEPAPTVTYSESDVIFSGEISYRINNDAMIYFNTGQGYRSGGAVNQILPEMPTQYEHDYTWNYELGLKTSWADGAVTANVALYQINFYDMQYSVDFGGGGFEAQVNCSGKCAKAEGAELEVNAQISENLRLIANISHNKATIEKNLPNDPLDPTPTDPTGWRALKGDPLITRAPEVSASGGVEYFFPLRANFEGYVYADVQHTGKVDRVTNLRDAGGAISGNFEMPAFTTANLKVGIESESWGANLFVRNLTDELGAVFQNEANSPNLGARVINMPRTMGVEFRWRTN